MKRQHLLTTMIACLTAVLAGAADNVRAAPQSASPAVLELFTSQGCSSCPPADALIGAYAKRRDLIVLSYSVDYWDSLGWHDTLGSPANSRRQRDYAQVRGDGEIYTPQVVVDGVRDAVGSNKPAVDAAIESSEARLAAVKVPMAMHAENGMLVIALGAAPSGSDRRVATVWLASVKSRATVHILRGENGGRSIAYHNSVRQLSPVGAWQGQAMSVRLPLKDLKLMGGDRLVALLQVEDLGPILGAADFAGF